MLSQGKPVQLDLCIGALEGASVLGRPVLLTSASDGGCEASLGFKRDIDAELARFGQQADRKQDGGLPSLGGGASELVRNQVVGVTLGRVGGMARSLGSLKHSYD